MPNESLRPTVLEVRLGQTLVGTITNLPNDLNLFLFDKTWTEDPDRPTLSQYYFDVMGALRTRTEQVQTSGGSSMNGSTALAHPIGS